MALKETAAGKPTPHLPGVSTGCASSHVAVLAERAYALQGDSAKARAGIEQARTPKHDLLIDSTLVAT